MPVTPTYDLIASNVLSSSASSVTFSSIPATYRDLVLVGNFDGTDGATCRVGFNSDTGSNYPYVFMFGKGSATATGSGTETGVITVGWVNTTNNLFQISIFDYAQTDKHKTSLVRGSNQNSNEGAAAYAARWANTAVITSLTASVNTGNFASGSSFYLYGIAS